MEDLRVGPIVVEGLRDLSVAFAKADKKLGAEFRATERLVAEPVRMDAETLSVANIRNIGETWSKMRIGVTRTGVYIAPKQRGVKNIRELNARRPNLAHLLLSQMTQALAQNQGEVIAGFEALLSDVGREWETA